MTDIGQRLSDFESDGLSEEDTLQLFADLITTGLAWQLQGYYSRTAAAWIESGAITVDPDTGIARPAIREA